VLHTRVSFRSEACVAATAFTVILWSGWKLKVCTWRRHRERRCGDLLRAAERIRRRHGGRARRILSPLLQRQKRGLGGSSWGCLQAVSGVAGEGSWSERVVERSWQWRWVGTGGGDRRVCEEEAAAGRRSRSALRRPGQTVANHPASRHPSLTSTTTINTSTLPCSSTMLFWGELQQ
jgi:hypothetical protein